MSAADITRAQLADFGSMRGPCLTPPKSNPSTMRHQSAILSWKHSTATTPAQQPARCPCRRRLGTINAHEPRMLVRRDGRPRAHTKGVQEGGETNDTGESARWSARHCYYEVLWVVASRHGHAAAALRPRRRRHHQARHVVEQEGIHATRQVRNL